MSESNSWRQLRDAMSLQLEEEKRKKEEEVERMRQDRQNLKQNSQAHQKKLCDMVEAYSAKCERQKQIITDREEEVRRGRACMR